MTQCSPCYSAVSSSLMKPLPDCSNYSPFSHTHYPTLSINTSLVSSGHTLYQAAPLEKNTSLLQRFTAEFSPEVMSSEEYRSSLRKLNHKQRQVILLFKLSSQFPFVSFSFLSISIISLLPFSILPFLIFPSHTTIPSISSDQFYVL